MKMSNLENPRLIGITQGCDIPSTRFRWSQHVSGLENSGFEVSELASHFGAYPPVSRNWRPVWFAAAYAENFLRAFRSRKFGITFLQRNLISTLCTLEPLLKKPLIFDVDDAIFLGARGGNADQISRISSLTICGNEFLANHFSAFGSVVVLPTAVDDLRYCVSSERKKDLKVVGWSGSSSGFKYLYEIEPAILNLLQKYPDAVLKIVSDRRPVFKTLPRDKVLYERWTVDREVAVLQEFSVGIMPLEDSLWARGKCSFKMLTYMAVGIPVVVSPVGMNSEVLSQAKCGFGPRNNEEWVDAISCLLDSSTLSESMGFAGRKLIEERYSKSVIGLRLVEILKAQI